MANENTTETATAATPATKESLISKITPSKGTIGNVLAGAAGGMLAAGGVEAVKLAVGHFKPKTASNSTGGSRGGGVHRR